MSAPPLPVPLETAWRRWFPCPGSALLLAGLMIVMGLLRGALVSSKALAKAEARWSTARRDAEGVPFKWEDAAVLGTHWSTMVALALLAALLLTMRWWQPPTATPTAGPPRHAVPAAPRWFLPALLGIVVAGAALRVPLATGSLWWDELWNVKYATVGEWRQEPEDPDKVWFQPTSWARAAWYYNKPTNHPVLTLPSKACHEIWRAVTLPADPGAFNELVLRLPVLLGGLGAVMLTGLLGRRFAGARAGLLAAALMALHPWLIRYGVDARSYGLAVAFTVAALYTLDRAAAPETRHPSLWWWLFAACQFFLMWSHVVAHLALCAALFAAAVWLILKGHQPAKGRQLAHLGVINAVAAVLLLTAFLPNLLQALTWGGLNKDGNLLTGPYLLRTLAQITAGMDPPPGSDAAGIPFLPWWGLILLTAAGGAAVLGGILTLFRRQDRAGWIVVSVLAGSALFLLAVRLTDFFFYHRFILGAGVPLLLLAGIGLGRLRSAALAGVVVTGFAVLTWPQTRLLTGRSYAPFRETVGDLRAAARHHPGKPIPVGYGLGSHVMQCYYPELRDIRSDAAASLQALIDQARREHRPLLVALGYEQLNRLNLPDGFSLLDNPSLFEHLSSRHGIEPEFTFHLLRLKPPVP